MNTFSYILIKSRFVLLYVLVFVIHLTKSNPICAQCAAPIAVFPYTEDFESNNGGWTSGGTANDWAWGVPLKTVISSAGSGTKCWITGGLINSSYNGNERSWVQSPCFNFTNIVLPVVQFKLFWETEKQYDGGNFQYSINGGTTWTNVGSKNDVSDCINGNWYNYQGITNINQLTTVLEGWSGNIQPTSGNCQGGFGSGSWYDVIHSMPYLAGEPQVLFRFTFGSGTICNDYDGFAFDKIILLDKPPLPTLSYVATAAGCTTSDGMVTINVAGGSAPLNYSWMPAVGSGLSATGLAAGTYTFAAADTFGCSVSIQAIVPQSPPVNLTVISFPDTCQQHTGFAIATGTSGTAPYQYAWSSGSTNANLPSLAVGSYTVTVTDSKGCTAFGFAVIDETGSIAIDLGPDREICGPGTEILDAGTFSSYLWQDGSTLSSIALLKPGTYSVQVTNSGGCTATDSLQVTENCLQDIIVPGAFTPNEDGFNELFQAYGVNITSYFMQIRSRWGELVFQSRNMNQGWNGMNGTIKAPEGIYIWKIIFASGSNPSQEKKGTVFLIR